MIAKRDILFDQGATWRAATASDLNAIERIANVVHPDLAERPDVFAEKLDLFPEGCFVLVKHDILWGYAFVHPWNLNDIPKLNQFLFRLPASSECLLIHDVAVLVRARGHGASKFLLERVANLARERGLSCLALVSVYNSHLHWERLGFQIVSNDRLADKLKSYGETARYMVCSLD